MERNSTAAVSVKTRQVNGLNLFKVAYPPRLRQPRHTHELAALSFVMAGNYAESFGRKTFARRDSTVVFHPPEESHAVDFETEVRILSVQFETERLARLREHSAVLDEPASLRSENINHLGWRVCREFQNPDAFSALAIEGLILEILAEASRRKAATEQNFPRWLRQTRDFLHANFAASLVVDDIARIAGVHPVHLARVFRQKFGCTIGEYLRRLRVEFANREIAATETPLSEIALAAGFADQSHLNKTFKSVFGLTPAEHRKLAQK